MSAVFATASHQATASLLPVNGGELTRRTGCAPRSDRSWRKVRMLARYWAVEADHGVGVAAPKSSFSTISGVVQPPVAATAVAYRFCAAAAIVVGSAGAFGV